jgi:unsaturated chondroitin disaccharide hydrolase
LKFFKGIANQFITLIFLNTLFLVSCEKEADHPFYNNKIFEESIIKIDRSLSQLEQLDQMPRYIKDGDQFWSTTDIYSWTSGFWPGILWLIYEYTRENIWAERANDWTMALKPVKNSKNQDHDLGFIFYTSFGNGWRLTKNETYKNILLETADSLLSLYNPKVGTLLSWPKRFDEGVHNTIIDNMMNLEILFWAAEETGNQKYYDAAVNHTLKTKKHHIRADSTTYHVVLFDPTSGKIINKLTQQGYSDESMWARGQAWAIYGFTMVYRETGTIEFMKTACALADKYIQELPDDMVPYWDFNSTEIPFSEKDASAAAITSSALFELSDLVPQGKLSFKYKQKANEMLKSLYNIYRANSSKVSILDHSVGNHNTNSEVDVPVIYADYYFLEALLRQKALRESGISIKNNK